ncbi:MAG: hypothetical protein EVA89_19260 [Sandaracinaceae bacterium]|nr:MAG: hypothetical protein EVA89_19260 [Sandaracinaceae bacterium]
MTTDRHTRWTERQEELKRLLRELGAEGCGWQVDLARGAFWWQRPGEERPVAVAKARLLCSQSISDGTVLPSWLNRTVPEDARVPPVEGLRSEGCFDEAGAWAVAMQIGDAAGARYLYPAASPQLRLFLGLRDVREAREEDPRFEPGSPWPHVVDVIGTLGRTLGERSPDDTRALLRHYGGGLVSSPAYRDTPEARPLEALGEGLRTLANAPDAELHPGLVALMRQAEAALAQPEDSTQ